MLGVLSDCSDQRYDRMFDCRDLILQKAPLNWKNIRKNYMHFRRLSDMTTMPSLYVPLTSTAFFFLRRNLCSSQ
jgi:hypothetical protein